jgi:hypothetical protein
MRIRRLAGAMLTAGFVALVIHAAAASQCPAREMGACARVHAMLMQQPAPPATVELATEPMRGIGRHG